MTVNLTTYRIASLITAPEIDTDLLWGLSLFFVGLATLYFVSVFVFRNKINSKSSRTKLRKNELSPMVSEFLFYEDDADKSEKSNYIELKIAIRELLRDDFNRKVLTEILLDLRKDVSGDTQKRLFKLYQDLSLEKDAFSKLKSWRWEVISKGILELTLMQVEDAYGFIVKFINDRRATIRKQAEIATVTLKPGGIAYFLDTTKYKISEWQQLKLLDVLRNKEDFEAPRFKAWLTSTNKHVVLFALRLIKHYRQNDANASVVELIKHKDDQVRRQAIDCIKEFNVVNALPTLKGVFKKSSVEIKIAILGAIAELGTSVDIEFLESVSQREGNFSVKSKAVGAINTIAPGSVMPTEGIEYVKSYHEPERPERPEEPDEQHPPPVHDDDRTYSEPEIGQEPKLNLDFIPKPIPTEKSIPMPGEKQSDPYLRNIQVEFEEILPSVSDGVSEQILEEIEVVSDEVHPSNASERASEQILNDIEVVFDEVHPASSDETLTQKSNPFKEIEDFNVSDIHFLPVVVANEIDEASEVESGIDETDSTTGNFKKDKSEVSSDRLNDIEVHSVDIVSETLDEELEALVAEIKEIAFLPFVTDEKQTTDATSTNDIERVADTTEAEQTKTIAKTNSPKERETAETTKAAEEEDPLEEERESIENVEGYSLSDFEISFAEKSADSDEIEPVEFKLEEEPIEKEPMIDVENPQVEDVMSWLMADNELRNIECDYHVVSETDEEGTIQEFISRPVYYDEHEAYMMGLLDDLEELGDQREIPLLEELKAEESKSFIKDRIDAMILKFNHKRDTKQAEDAKPKKDAALLPVFSVFADLFKSIDSESKLILLDEIVAVGDEKEIEFLDGLLEDPDHKIREKAQNVLKLLIAKLSRENPSATYSKGVSAIVAEQIKDDETLSEEIFENLLSELNLSPAEGDLNPSADKSSGSDTSGATDETNQKFTEIKDVPSQDDALFDVDFQICEILDKKCAPDILNLPVISTEVLPNDNGGSFFTQMRNFTKLFF